MNQFRFSIESLESVLNGARDVGFGAKTILFSLDSPQNRDIVVVPIPFLPHFFSDCLLIILFKYNNLEYVVFKLLFVHRKFRFFSKAYFYVYDFL